MSTTRNRCERRSALTLIELLIVMGLLIILASISLGAMKTLLRGQKVSQASVTVRQYLQNAQTRAIASGRPVAVFFDRVSMTGGVGGVPLAPNHTVTRLQLGEVFPPYTGDVENSLGRLVSFSNANTYAEVGYANALVFENSTNNTPLPPNLVTNVASGLGFANSGVYVKGFISIGDNIEIDGCQARFEIVSFNVIQPTPMFPNGGLSVVFRNAGLATFSSVDTGSQLPISKPVLQPVNVAANLRKFRVYRQPSKSLVGAVVLPRGTCVDLSLSGVGINDSAIESGRFGLTQAPFYDGIDPNNRGNPGNFSRIAVIFNSEGRVAYLMREDSISGSLARRVVNGSSMIYLMVGRTDQVLPGFPANPGNLSESARRAALQHPDFGASDLPKSNLVDPENVWVTCNPITGEVKTSPVVAIEDADIAARYNLPAVPITDLINQTRSLAAAGISN